MAGLIHIYCGDGKGKTTAAVGLTVRAAGAGKTAVFAQFFKDGSSSEIKSLQCLGNVHIMHCDTVRGFFRNMTDEQKVKVREDYTALFRKAISKAKGADLLILDEIISACNHGTVPEKEVLEFLSSKPETLEVVLTGRNPSRALLAVADYVTEMRKIRHPFDCGITARKGIEF